MMKNLPRIKPRIHEWMTVDLCIREKFVDGLWTRLVAVRELQSATGEELRQRRTLLPSVLRPSRVGFQRRVMESDKANKSTLLVLLVSMVFSACSPFTRAEETPTPNYIFAPENHVSQRWSSGKVLKRNIRLLWSENNPPSPAWRSAGGDTGVPQRGDIATKSDVDGVRIGVRIIKKNRFEKRR